MSMDKKEKLETLKILAWDRRIEPERMLAVIEGAPPGPADIGLEEIFRAMLASLPWHRIVGMLGLERVKNLLTDETISKLWPGSLRTRYGRIRSILRGEPVPPAGWGPADNGALPYPLLSDRWYSPRAGTLRP
jgi:hypothetical protein